VPLGDDFDGTVGHFDGGLIVNRVPTPWADYTLAELAQRVGLLRRALERGEGPAYALGGLLDAAVAAELQVLRVVGGGTDAQRPGPQTRSHRGTARGTAAPIHRADPVEQPGQGTAHDRGRTDRAA